MKLNRLHLKNFFIRNSLMFLSLFLGITSVHAYHYNHEETWTFKASPDSVKNLLLDVTNQCSQGCRYFIPSVTETKIVEKENENHFFIWSYVNSTRDSYFFQEVSIKKNNQQQTIVEFKFPAQQKQNELRVKYNLGINSHFQMMTTLYTFTPIYDENGKFKETKVQYTIDMDTDSWLVSRFSSTVFSSMAASSQATKNILSQAQ
jgi:hypothetical protein